MPWKVINQMDVKIELVSDWNNGYFSITDLSQKYGVSRPTIYKWLKRYKYFGIEGLKEQSRAPKHCPHRTSKKILDIVIEEILINQSFATGLIGGSGNLKCLIEFSLHV
jgi:transposase